MCGYLGCASYGYNYLSPAGPRCAGRFRDAPPEVEAAAPSAIFKIASFNIKFGKEPLKALETLRRGEQLDADLLLLQEMDLRSTIQVARELGHDYVYYPANVHPASGRQFGVAILSPWPIRGDRKILLARLDSSDDARKIALVAIVWIKGIPVGVVNVHLQSGLSPVWLGDQLQAITSCVYTERCLQDGAPMLPELPYYVMAGDFNTRGSEHIAVMRKVLSWAGLEPVPGIGKTQKYLTTGMGRLDHIFASGGLTVEDSGVVPGFFGTGSDHRPVWAVLRFSGQKREPWSGFDGESPWDAPTPPTAVECTCATVDCS